MFDNGEVGGIHPGVSDGHLKFLPGASGCTRFVERCPKVVHPDLTVVAWDVSIRPLCPDGLV